MRITVRFFAILKDRAGETETTLEVPSGSTVAAVMESLIQCYPDLQRDCKRIAFAVNRSYVRPEHVLSDGDELALIPPVSGG